VGYFDFKPELMSRIDRTAADAIWKLALEKAAQKAIDNGSPTTAKKIKRIKPDWPAITEIVFAEPPKLILTGIAL